MTFFGDDGGLTSTFWKDSNFPRNDSRAVSMRSCYPAHFEYQPDLFVTDGYIYSPGVCPSGYYAAKSNGLKGGSGTAATSWCCPHGMTFSAFQGCVSLTTPTSTTTLYQNHEKVQMIAPYVVLEPYIPVAWASGDLHLFTPTSAPLSVSQACRAQARASVANTGIPGTAGKHVPGSPGGLSTGAKAGVGVGVAFAAVAAIAMIVLLLKYRRKAQVSAAELEKRDQPENFESMTELVMTELQADETAEADCANARHEPDSISVKAELNSPIVILEADASNLRHELDSGWHGHEK